MKRLSRRSSAHDRPEEAAGVTTRHTLRTGSWIADVASLEIAISRLAANRPVTNDCQVVFFEIAGDDQLHVNVTHRHPIVAIRGWAGPARVPEGFVHNRRFEGTTPNRMMPHLRDMIFAATADAN